MQKSNQTPAGLLSMIMRKISENGNSWEPDYDSVARRIDTDKSLEEKVVKALTDNIFIDFTKIKVRVKDRLVFLEGAVAGQQERTSAQECIRDIFGIKAVINYLTYHTQYAR